MENVPGLVEQTVFQSFVDFLRKAKFDVHYKTLTVPTMVFHNNETVLFFWHLGLVQ